MPRGASPKRERQYEHIKQSARKSGRYGGRAEEVAARTVNKVRSETGETKSKRASSKKPATSASSSKSRTATSRPTKSRTTRSQSGARKSSTSRSGGSGRRRRPSSNGRGFAGMSAQRQREIAAQGGRAAHEQGTAHEFSRAEARKAGQKGGEAVSRNRSHMAEIGRRGGER